MGALNSAVSGLLAVINRAYLTLIKLQILIQFGFVHTCSNNVVCVCNTDYCTSTHFKWYINKCKYVYTMFPRKDAAATIYFSSTAMRRLFEVWTIRGVDYSRCGLFEVWTIRGVDYSRCGLFEVWTIRGVDYSRCGIYSRKYGTCT